jgi:hypothetical protein
MATYLLQMMLALPVHRLVEIVALQLPLVNAEYSEGQSS